MLLLGAAGDGPEGGECVHGPRKGASIGANRQCVSQQHIASAKRADPPLWRT